MRLGALLAPLGPDAPPDALARQAESLEALGYDGLWTAHAVGRGFMVTDPLIGLAVVASVTKQVELGTAILQLPLEAPALLAHRIFSLMQLCGDRLRLGVGPGSTEADFIVAGREYASRFSRFDASLSELRQLFASGHSDAVDLSPWPSLAGGPQMLYGTWGKGVKRAAHEFDGWIASAHYRTPDEVCQALDRYRAEGGRRALVSTIILGADRPPEDARALLAQFAQAGFDDAVVMFAPGGPSPAEVRGWVA